MDSHLLLRHLRWRCIAECRAVGKIGQRSQSGDRAGVEVRYDGNQILTEPGDGQNPFAGVADDADDPCRCWYAFQTGGWK